MNEQPKWQRARVVKSLYESEAKYVGMEFWVRAGVPVSPDGELRVSTTGGMSRTIHPWYHTNLFTKESLMIGVSKEVVELLARGPEDFADEVERQELK